MCQREEVSSSWKQKPVIRGPAHNPALLHLPILLNSGTQSDMKVLKTEFNKLFWGCRLDSPITTLATSTLLLVSPAFCVQIVWLLDIANWHEAPWKLGLFIFYCERHTAFSLLQPIIQTYLLGGSDWCQMSVKDKTYSNVIFSIISQPGFQKACWCHQVEGVIFLPGLTWFKRYNLIG